MAKKRKNYSPAKKVQILKKHLVDRIPLSDICDQYDLHPTVLYRWQKAFFENGASAVDSQGYAVFSFYEELRCLCFCVRHPSPGCH